VSLFNDVNALMSRAVNIICRYSVLYVAASYSTHLPNADDYKGVLEAVHRDLLSREARDRQGGV
jgi:hypothetical protein